MKQHLGLQWPRIICVFPGVVVGEIARELEDNGIETVIVSGIPTAPQQMAEFNHYFDTVLESDRTVFVPIEPRMRTFLRERDLAYDLVYPENHLRREYRTALKVSGLKDKELAQFDRQWAPTMFEVENDRFQKATHHRIAKGNSFLQYLRDYNTRADGNGDTHLNDIIKSMSTPKDLIANTIHAKSLVRS